MSKRRPTRRTEPQGHTRRTDHHADDRERWASLYTLLAEGLKHPDERLYRDVKAGRFAAEYTALAEALSIPVPDGPGSPDAVPTGRAAFDREYTALFEGLRTPYAPLVESVYRPWHDGTAGGGLLGPPAADMQRRYDAGGFSVPSAYQPDHLALVFEYAAALLRTDERTAYRSFLEHHLDWVPALERLADAAAADSPFHRYCVAAACETVTAARERAGVTGPDPDAVEAMVDRAEIRIE
ncbi:TorD/DmsD family molecular chaperone [Halorubrum vacuolatum]|uniref:Nitrate reductase delta subunit n=1 Tax=Halorubrum vacuolatum TaxID=63740 RepID=A0A238VWY7_HALVU|nr:molecular chaperone TorD family protein [Halorubrum vacuolatum]SNR38832.1 Nitrate reductase delta subunit [Halorubrum vacuolatum]